VKIIAITVLTILAITITQFSDAEDLIIPGNGNAPILISSTDNGRFDFDNDGLNDFYVKAHFTGNDKQQYKVTYKFLDSCVQGSAYESARMKIGFTNTEINYLDRVWLSDGIQVWNPWFKSKNNDENKLINLADNFPDGNPSPFSISNGDDIIVRNQDDKKGSFTHVNKIKELDGQTGWSGSVFFNAPAGEYFMWAIMPGGGPGCSALSGLAIPIIIES